MFRKIVVLSVSVLAVVAMGCSKEEPAAEAPPTSIPVDTAVVDVSVTIAPTPSSIDPSLLPANARLASVASFLTTEQKICVDSTIYETVKADPSIGEINGKLASVMGHAVVLCATPAGFAKAFALESKAKFNLNDEQAACLESAMANDPDGAARFYGSIAITDPQAAMDAIRPFEEACSFTFG